MGLDLNSLFGQAKDAASQGMNDLLKTGGNAAIGYLEKQAVSIIQQDQAQHEKDFQDATMNILNRPTSADGIGSYIGNLAQSPTLKKYGAPMLAGIAVVAALAVLLWGSK